MCLKCMQSFLEPRYGRKLKEIGVLPVHVKKFGIHPHTGQEAVLASISDQNKFSCYTLNVILAQVVV